jgi:hypothetical protein
MTTTSSPPISLPYVHRPRRLTGDWVSLMVACCLVVVAVLAGGIVAYFWLAQLGHWFRLVVPTLMLFGCWLGIWAMVANYRRTAAIWHVDFDEIECSLDSGSTLVRFDQVTGLRVRPKCAILVARGERALQLPNPVAQALAHSNLIDHMLAEIGSTIRSEGAWCVRARPAIGVLHVAGGLALVGVAFSSFFHVGHIGQAVKMIGDGRRFFGRGLVLTPTGIKTSVHDFSTIPWADIVTAVAGPDGLVIDTTGGQKLRVSPYADNYVPMVAYLDRMISEPGDETASEELWPEFSDE